MFSLASTAVKTVLQVNKPTGKPPGFLWVRAAQSSHEPHGEKGAYAVTTTLGDHAQINVEGVFEPIDDLNTVRDEGLGKFLVTEAGSGPVSMNSKGETNTLRNPSRKGPWNPQFPVASGRMNRSKRYLDGRQREREDHTRRGLCRITSTPIVRRAILLDEWREKGYFWSLSMMMTCLPLFSASKAAQTPAKPAPIMTIGFSIGNRERGG